MFQYVMSDHGPAGQLEGSPSVQTLQQSLANLAIATNRPGINPGPINGEVGPATMAAIVQGLGLLSEQLPSWLYLALQGALAVGSNTATAKTFVTSYATQLAIAANTAAVKYKTTPAAATTPTVVGFFAPGWYKTPIGMAILAVVALLGYKFIVAPRRAAA